MQYYNIRNNERFEIWLQYDPITDFSKFYGVIDNIPSETILIYLSSDMIQYCINSEISLIEDEYNQDAPDVYSYSINIDEVYTQSYRYGQRSQLLPLRPIKLSGPVAARWRIKWLTHKIEMAQYRLHGEADDPEQVEYFQSRLHDYHTELTTLLQN